MHPIALITKVNLLEMNYIFEKITKICRKLKDNGVHVKGLMDERRASPAASEIRVLSTSLAGKDIGVNQQHDSLSQITKL